MAIRSGMPIPIAAKTMWNASDSAIWERAKKKSVTAAPPRRRRQLEESAFAGSRARRRGPRSSLSAGALALLEEPRELGGEHQQAPDRGDQPDDQEGLRHERVLAEGELHGVEELDDHQDQEDPVEQIHGAVGQRGAEQGLHEGDGHGDEQHERDRCQERSQAHVDRVLDPHEALRDQSAPGLRVRPELFVGHQTSRLLATRLLPLQKRLHQGRWWVKLDELVDGQSTSEQRQDQHRLQQHGLAHLRLLFPAPPVPIPQCVSDRRSTFSWAMPSLSRIALRRASSRSAAAACCLRRMSPNTTQASSKLSSSPVFMASTLQVLPGPPSHRPRLARTPRCIRSSSSRVAMILHVGARRGGFQTVRFLKLSSHTSNLTAAGSLVSPLNSHLKDQDENRSA